MKPGCMVEPSKERWQKNDGKGARSRDKFVGLGLKDVVLILVSFVNFEYHEKY